MSSAFQDRSHEDSGISPERNSADSTLITSKSYENILPESPAFISDKRRRSAFKLCQAKRRDVCNTSQLSIHDSGYLRTPPLKEPCSVLSPPAAAAHQIDSQAPFFWPAFRHGLISPLQSGQYGGAYATSSSGQQWMLSSTPVRLSKSTRHSLQPYKSLSFLTQRQTVSPISAASSSATAGIGLIHLILCDRHHHRILIKNISFPN